MSTINPLRFLPWPFPPVQAEKLPFGLPLAPNDGFFPGASDVQNPIGILCCNGYWAPNVWGVPVEFSVQPIWGMVPKVFVFRNQKSLCLWLKLSTYKDTGTDSLIFCEWLHDHPSISPAVLHL